MDQLYTINEVLAHIENSYSNPKALNTYINNKWVSISTKDYLKQVEYIALALRSLGVKKGDTVGIYSAPSARWMIVDLAIMASGAITVPLFTNLSFDNWIFEVNQTEIKTIFAFGKEQIDRCLENKKFFSQIILLEEENKEEEEFRFKELASYDTLLKVGKKLAEEDPSLFYKMRTEISGSDVATIIYTSGSTGVPKGAVHTHRSITSLVHTELFHLSDKKDSLLSFLPTAHILARGVNFIVLSWGVSIYYYNDIKNLGFAFKDVKPTITIVVPRLLEKIYASIMAKAQSASAIKKKLILYACNLASQENPSIISKFLMKLLDPIVYKKLREGLGGRLRVIISGGAPLGEKLCLFFINSGFPVFEGYGLTETCPVTVNLPGKTKAGSVGPIIPQMNITIGEGGEVLISGPMMFKEYYKNEEQTKKILSQTGVLHTGDKGRIDSEGYLHIVGRLKELMKTSTGEMIAPVPIEQALIKSPYIDQALIIGDNRKFTSALFVPNFENLEHLKKKKGLQKLQDEEFLAHPLVKQEIREFLDGVNKHLNIWERVQEYRFIPSPLTIENGDITPSMKIRRDAVERKYKKLIDSIYEEATNEI